MCIYERNWLQLQFPWWVSHFNVGLASVSLLGILDAHHGSIRSHPSLKWNFLGSGEAERRRRKERRENRRREILGSVTRQKGEGPFLSPAVCEGRGGGEGRRSKLSALRAESAWRLRTGSGAVYGRMSWCHSDVINVYKWLGLMMS